MRDFLFVEISILFFVVVIHLFSVCSRVLHYKNTNILDTYQMLTQMFQDMTGAGEEAAPPAIEKKQSSKAGGKTARRGKRD